MQYLQNMLPIIGKKMGFIKNAEQGASFTAQLYI